MKMLALAVFAAAATTGAPAAAQHAGHGEHGAAPATVPTVEGTGVVKKIDAKAGTVTIDHDPIRALNWPAMTMAFKVPDKAVLEQMKVGSKIRFQLSGGQTIVSVRPL